MTGGLINQNYSNFIKDNKNGDSFYLLPDEMPRRACSNAI